MKRHDVLGRADAGFTLIELLVAISIMALMAVLSWRGLDGMTRAQAQLQTRADALLTLQAGLNQWGTDLDALVQLPQTPPIDWDGRALRLTRRSPVAMPDPQGVMSDEAVQVVAWSRSEEAERWLRENKIEASKVVRLTIAELRSSLMSMPEEWRRYYSLEVI